MNDDIQKMVVSLIDHQKKMINDDHGRNFDFLYIFEQWDDNVEMVHRGTTVVDVIAYDTTM